MTITTTTPATCGCESGPFRLSLPDVRRRAALRLRQRINRSTPARAAALSPRARQLLARISPPSAVPVTASANSCLACPAHWHDCPDHWSAPPVGRLTTF